jgi:outer membrane protein assembly factor BamB
VSPDSGLPEAIDRDKNVLWSVQLPDGNSSPIVFNGRLFITGHEGDERIVLCLDAGTGETVWRRSFMKVRTEVFNRRNGPTTPSPTTDGQRVFVFFPDFGLLAYDLEGKELWRASLGPFSSIQGLAASPIVAAGKVLLLIDTPEEAYLSAFDAATGNLVWKKDRPTGLLGSYATPTVYEHPDGPVQVVVAGAVELTGYEVGTGERVWWVRDLSFFPTGPPFVIGDSVFTLEPAEQVWPTFAGILPQFDKDGDGQIQVEDTAHDLIWSRSFVSLDKNLGNGDGVVTSEEYGRASGDVLGGGLTRTRVTGKGDTTETHVLWRHLKGMPSLSGALLYDNLLYVVNKAIILTFDPETGEMLERVRVREALGEYYASPVAADGKIYLVNLDGIVSILRAGREWGVLSVGDLEEQTIATPAIADSRIFIRTQKTLYCFGLK